MDDEKESLESSLSKDRDNIKEEDIENGWRIFWTEHAKSARRNNSGYSTDDSVHPVLTDFEAIGRKDRILRKLEKQYLLKKTAIRTLALVGATVLILGLNAITANYLKDPSDSGFISTNIENTKENTDKLVIYGGVLGALLTAGYTYLRRK